MKSWFLAGSDPQDYELGIDANVVRNGKNSGYLKAKVAEPRGFGTLMQMFKADDYRNKRMRFSAVVKSAGIEEWAGLWMRIDGQKQGETLAFDNMQNRPIQGTTDWQKYEVCLDVPQESVCVAFGLLLAGKGQAWLSEVELEAVSAEVPTTSFEGYEGLPEKPGHHFLHLISIIGEIVPVLVAGFGGVLGALLAQSFHIPFWVSLLIAAAILLAIWAPGRFHARKTDYPAKPGNLDFAEDRA